VNGADWPESGPQRSAAGIPGAAGSRGDSSQGGTGNAPSSPPAISLPMGGGAIRGIGEKFSDNPVTGTGSLSVPVVLRAKESRQTLGLDCPGSTQPPSGGLRDRRSRRKDVPQVVEQDSRELQTGTLLQRFLGGLPRGDPEEHHEAVSKDSGELAHVESWNNTLRQRLSRFVRKALSFSKSDEMHKASLKLFLHRHNDDVILR
jgi:hypothetical protein